MSVVPPGLCPICGALTGGLRQGQRAHIGGLGKLGKFAQCPAFGYILLSLDGWNLKEKQQEDRTDGRNDCESQVRC